MLTILDVLKGRLPLLESLDLAIRNSAAQVAIPEDVYDAFKNALSLKDLTLNLEEGVSLVIVDYSSTNGNSTGPSYACRPLTGDESREARNLDGTWK